MENLYTFYHTWSSKIEGNFLLILINKNHTILKDFPMNFQKFDTCMTSLLIDEKEQVFNYILFIINAVKEHVTDQESIRNACLGMKSQFSQRMINALEAFGSDLSQSFKK